ncbi:MAG: hypothetical protein KGI45_03610 [Patescibacteria group bacterium]|nr:hypothetical protein [Patescibacteria group bacterium]
MNQGTQIKLILNLGDKVKISPPIWMGNRLEVQPGDLTRFAPTGTGVYGYFEPVSHPFKGTSVHEDSGGVVYFGKNHDKRDFEAMLRLLGVHTEARDYAVFTQAATNPIDYLHQMRIVSRFAMRHMYGALDDESYKRFEDQSMTVAEILRHFIEANFDKYRSGRESLTGLIGGDEDFEIESLAFGFMVENSYHQVYRIWSRAWLVTK